MAFMLGGLMQARGAIEQGKAQAKAAEVSAQMAERDAEVVDQNRKLALVQADIDATDKRRQNRRTMGAIRAKYGASGVSMAGSPLDVLEDTATEQELDTERVRYEGRIRGREGALQMLGLQDQAKLDRMQGRAAYKAGYYNANAAVFSAVGQSLSRMA